MGINWVLMSINDFLFFFTFRIFLLFSMQRLLLSFSFLFFRSSFYFFKLFIRICWKVFCSSFMLVFLLKTRSIMLEHAAAEIITLSEGRSDRTISSTAYWRRVFLVFFHQLHLFILDILEENFTGHVPPIHFLYFDGGFHFPNILPLDAHPQNQIGVVLVTFTLQLM